MSAEKKVTGYPSIDKPWMKYYLENDYEMGIPECTVYENIYAHNSSHLSDIAIEYFGRRITYGTLFDNVEKAKLAFVANGVNKGDKVIMFTSATPELLYSVLALCRIGAVVNMINPLFTANQIEERINETEAQNMIVLDQLYSKIQPIINKLCVNKIVVVPVCREMPSSIRFVATLKLKKKISYDKNIIEWKHFILEGKNESKVDDIKYEKNMPFVMVYSSGTTGASKGIVLTNNGINATIAHYLSPDFPYERGDKFLQIVPTWFSTGLVLCLLMPICLGVKVVMEPVFSKENFVKDIKKYRPNMILGATSLWNYAKDCEELRDIDLSFIRYPISGGEAILPNDEEAINKFLNNAGCKSSLLKGYGMCELGSTVSTESLLKHKRGSTGFPIKGVTIAAFDVVTNEEKKYNERGEIRVDSPAHMMEYFKNTKATEEYFYKDNKDVLWGKTGDIGYVDEEGFLFILGRVNDSFINECGKIVYCFDIENEILSDESVLQCEVVGIDWGDYVKPVAHLVIKKNEALSNEEILTRIHQKCKDKLGESCAPRGYKIRSGFPVKNSGKRDMEMVKKERTGFVIPTETGLEKIIF